MNGSKTIHTGIIAITNTIPITHTGSIMQTVTKQTMMLQIISNIIFIFVFIVYYQLCLILILIPVFYYLHIYKQNPIKIKPRSTIKNIGWDFSSEEVYIRYVHQRLSSTHIHIHISCHQIQLGFELC